MNSSLCLEQLFNDFFPDDVNSKNRFQVGEVFYEYQPEKEKYKNMLHIVTYDIRNPKRLRKVAKICENFGFRVEYSVFECDLNEEQFILLWKTLEEAMDTDEDALLAYKVCGTCTTKIQSMGSISRPQKPLFYII